MNSGARNRSPVKLINAGVDRFHHVCRSSVHIRVSYHTEVSPTTKRMRSWNRNCTTWAIPSITSAMLDSLWKAMVIGNVFRMDRGPVRSRSASRSRVRMRPFRRTATHCGRSSRQAMRKSGRRFRVKRFSSDVKSGSSWKDLPDPSAWKRASGMWTSLPDVSPFVVRIRPPSTTAVTMQSTMNSSTLM